MKPVDVQSSTHFLPYSHSKKKTKFELDLSILQQNLN